MPSFLPNSIEVSVYRRPNSPLIEAFECQSPIFQIIQFFLNKHQSIQPKNFGSHSAFISKKKQQITAVTETTNSIRIQSKFKKLQYRRNGQIKKKTKEKTKFKSFHLHSIRSSESSNPRGLPPSSVLVKYKLLPLQISFFFFSFSDLQLFIPIHAGHQQSSSPS